MRSSSLRVATVTALTVVAIGVLAQSADARRRRFDPRLARASLVLVSFVQNGRTDVLRNEPLVFKFSAYLRKGSVHDRSIRIAAVTPSGLRPAVGAYKIKGTKVVFDPTQSQRNFEDAKKPDTEVTGKDNPQGFDSFQDHVMEIPGPPELAVLRNKRRARIRKEFNGTFRTSGRYLDPVPGQPTFVGDFATGQLAFDPPRSGSTGLVDEDALIVLEFSEPIELNTLDPASSIIVNRVAIGEQVPGFVKMDPNDRTGRRFLFVPSLGFGSDEVNVAGWDVEVTLTTEITDLAGNSLKRPKTFPIFRTRYVPGKPSSSILSESFDDQNAMDPLSITEGAEWNTLEEGVLIGGPATAFPPVDVQYTSGNTGTTVVRTRVVEPLVAETVPPSGGGGCSNVPNGSRTQMLYVPGDVGEPAAVTNVGWGPSSNALFAATHLEIELLMGHTSVNSLGTDWDANINIGTPLLTYSGDYSIPQRLNINPPGLETGYWDWPSFTSVFEYNGVNNVVFDAIVPGGNNCQIVRVGFVPAGVSFPNRRAVSRDKDAATANFGLGADTVIYDIRFKKRRRTTRGTSTWYELASDDPIFALPIVSPAGQPGGVQVLLELEGAQGKPDPFNPGGFIADPSTGTGFTTNVTDVDGHRFVRIRVTMIANLTTNQTARVSSVQVPYQF